MNRIFEGKLTVRRLIIFVAGLFILAFGIDLNTKTLLGVSPINSVCYNIHALFSVPLWLSTYLFYTALVFVQWIILRRRFHPFQFLQIATSFLSSLFVQFFDDILPVCHTWPMRVLMLFAAIVLTGVGASLSAGMKLLPNPGDGAAATIGEALKKDFGFGKNMIDLLCVGVSALICLLTIRRVINIGIGTLISMLLTGRVIKLVSGTTARIYKSVS